MRALYFGRDDRPYLVELPPRAIPGECVVRVHLAGICGTDLQLMRGAGNFNGVPGHEFVGTVEAAPEADAAWVGRRVVGEINVGCGRCADCGEGNDRHCSRRTVLGMRNRPGAFAETLSLPARNLHEVPPSLTDEEAVFAEPIAAACQILEQVPIDERTRVAVVGDGRLGLLAAQVLRSAGGRVTVVGHHATKLAVASTLGFDARLEAEAVTRAYDVVVDATGRPDGLLSAGRLVRPRGTIVLKSTPHGRAPMSLASFVTDEVAIVGSRCGPFSRALTLMTSGGIRTRELVSSVLPLSAFDEAFALARRHLKVLLAITPPAGGGRTGAERRV